MHWLEPALYSLTDCRSMCRARLQCILSGKWSECRHRSKQNRNSLCIYAEILKVPQILPDPDWCAKTEDPGIVRCIFCDVRGHLWSRDFVIFIGLWHTAWFCPIFLQEKDQHIDDALKKMDFAEEEPLKCQLSAIVPLSGFWSWAKPEGLSVATSQEDEGFEAFGSGQRFVTGPSYVFVNTCCFFSIFQPPALITQGHLTPPPALKSLEY